MQQRPKGRPGERGRGGAAWGESGSNALVLVGCDMARMPRSMLLFATPHAAADDDGGGQNGNVGGYVLLVRL